MKAECGCVKHEDHGSCAGCNVSVEEGGGCTLPSIHRLPTTTSLRVRIDRLLTLMEKNERDRELSPYWRHGDGSMMTRAEWEASSEWRERMRTHPGYEERDFYGKPLA